MATSSQIGLGGKVLLLCLVVVIVGAAMGMPHLSDRTFAIAEVILYVVLVILVAARLRACLRLAQGTKYRVSLQSVAFWVAAAVFSVFARVGTVLGSTDRDYIRLVTSGAAYLALLIALGIIETLLKQQPASNGTASTAAEPAPPG